MPDHRYVCFIRASRLQQDMYEKHEFKRKMHHAIFNSSTAHWLAIKSIYRLIHFAKYTGSDCVEKSPSLLDWEKSIKAAGVHSSKSTQPSRERLRETARLQLSEWTFTERGSGNKEGKINRSVKVRSFLIYLSVLIEEEVKRKRTAPTDYFTKHMTRREIYQHKWTTGPGYFLG